jgi:long-chain acyl-CoA synthetase
VLLFRGADAERPSAATLVDTAIRVGAEALAQDPELLARQAKGRGREAAACLVYPEGRETKSFLLSQDNILGAAAAFASLVGIGPSDVVLLAHGDGPGFRRTAALACLSTGATLAIVPPTDDLASAMREIAPTLVLVDRTALAEYQSLLSRRIDEKNFLARAVSRWAIEQGKKHAAPALAEGRIASGDTWVHRAADRLTLRGLRKDSGARVRFFVSEGIPLPVEASTFLFAAGLPVLEACAVPEASGLLSMNTPTALRLGTVGVPVPGVEVRIGAGGRIEVRGSLVASGKDPAAVPVGPQPRDGWVATGRFGRLEEAGYLVITDPPRR